MKAETEIEILTDTLEEHAKILKSIQKSMARQESKDSPSKIEIPAPIINVSVPPIKIPEAQVTVVQSESKMEAHPRKYVSTVTRNSYGYITSIETEVIG